MRDRYEHLRLVKLACGGETTTTMIVGSPWCGAGFATGSQLAEAKAFLHAHRGEVVFVTLDIGGNDVTSADGGGPAAVQVNLPTILAQLREAAGPAVPIVGMNYYHPFLPDVWFGTHDAAALLGAVEAITAFNDLLASLYTAAGDPLADVESAFSMTDVGDADGDGVPDNVEHVCAWTWRCASPHGPDIHPNNAGYGVIATPSRRRSARDAVSRNARPSIFGEEGGMIRRIAGSCSPSRPRVAATVVPARAFSAQPISEHSHSPTHAGLDVAGWASFQRHSDRGRPFVREATVVARLVPGRQVAADRGVRVALPRLTLGDRAEALDSSAVRATTKHSASASALGASR